MLLMSFLFPSLLSHVFSKHFLFLLLLKVDLTAYVEKHEFCFDAVLNEHVTNDEVMVLILQIEVSTYCCSGILDCRIFLNILIKYFSDVYDIVMLGFDGRGIFCLM